MAIETATIAGGCFWCTEAVFNDVIGVSKVESGYIGGHVPNPTYKQVCGGDTGHAEAIRVTFDTDQLSYGDLLDVFLGTHDPTQLNRQGNDRGRQYRSAVFFADAAQREVAEAYIRQLDEAKVFAAPIATEVVPLDAFYDAERYHQNYAEQHPEQSYIAYVAQPKVEKLRKDFGARLKDA